MSESVVLGEEKKRAILVRVEEKEYVKRCLAVDVCPECGEDHVDTESIASHFLAMSCPNKRCKEYNVIKRSQ